MLQRALFIDFSLYTDDDPDFKEELIGLMIENLQELKQAYAQSVDQRDPKIFQKACHKVKPTLSMLADRDLDAVVEDLKNQGADQSQVVIFNKLSAAIMDSLSAEKGMPARRTGTN